jgi:DNA polymerase-3 subunit alpha
MKEFVGAGSHVKKGFRRSTVNSIARFLGSDRLRSVAESDVFWDVVVSIEPAGEQDVYDLTVEDDHNFVADGLIVHNSHSTGYAIVAYQTAYLKTYFPVHYMAALLTYEAVSTDKVVEYIDECRKVRFPDGHRGIEVRPPDINLSDIGFTVVYVDGEPHDPSHGHIRFGLNAVKGVGDKAITAILAEREKGGDFRSLYEFCERVPLSAVNRSTIEALIKCGAFDSLHGLDSRAAMSQALDAAIQAGQRASADRDAGQLSFFDAFAEAPAGEDKTADAAGDASLPHVPPWSTNEMLQHEKSVLGFYVSSHPLDQHKALLERYGNVYVRDIRGLAAEVEVIVGGMLTRVRTTFTKTGKNPGQKMAMITIEDKTGSIDGVVFSNTYAIAAPLLVPDGIVFLRGKVDRRREEPSVRVESVIPIEQVASHLTSSVRIVLRGSPDAGQGNGNGNGRATPFNGELSQLKVLLRQSQPMSGEGAAEVMFEVHEAGQVVEMRLNGLRVGVTADLPDRIATILRRPGCCDLVGPPKLAARRDLDRLSHDEQGPQQPRLQRQTVDEEFCASIDRY